MNWYKNAKTATKLMLAFGTLAAMLAAVGYQGISAAGSLNSSLGTLYDVHFLGAAYLQEIKATVPMIGRELRQSLLVSEMGARQQAIQKLQEHFAVVEDDITRKS